uniref:Uncharacterized protein n=1 Tax=Bacillus phage KoopaTroopa TaxID=3234046 RepID=A0AB39C7N9_9CAUD
MQMSRLKIGDKCVYIFIGGFDIGTVTEVNDQGVYCVVTYEDEDGKTRCQQEEVLWTEDEFLKEYQLYESIYSRLMEVN